ncbi:MAG: hypothetical protein IT169_05030 [Bryobacterales bacterium]|nr:hypothetical protein [Bryobacterales bacterium]
MAGNWEPLIFIRRRGGHPRIDERNWMAERAERAAIGLKEAGVNLVITNLHKGFGIEAEKEDIDATRRFTRFAHKHGIRVGGYVGSTMMPETFFQEEPQAPGWMQKDENNRPVYYGPDQTFRVAACRNNPGYQAFIEKVLRLGIQDIGLDLIHFDQMYWYTEPYSCRCQFCRDRFLAWLEAKYPVDQRRPRFGFDDFKDIEPPPYIGILSNPSVKHLRSPLMQEWALWRASEVTRQYAAYDNYIHSLNPEAATVGNPNLNLALNLGFQNGVSNDDMLQHGDVVFSESPAYASWTPDGRLLSKIRSYKTARLMGKSIFAYTGGRYGTQSPDSPPHLRIAEAMAYNGNNIGMVGDVHPDGIRLTPEARRYIRFFHEHQPDFRDTAPLGDVAVLRAFAAVEFNPAQALVSAMLAEQTLIQHQIPFQIIFDRQVKDLSRYKVLVLANQDALSDEQVTAIRSFVNAGGGLVATENSSLLTDWRLRRDRFALADLFGTEQPGETAIRREFGRGRVVYLPRIAPAVPPPPPLVEYGLPLEDWQLPVNHAELAEAVEWASRGQSSAKVVAPPYVTMELTRQASTGSLFLHLVNFNFSHPVEGIEAQVRIPDGYTFREASSFTPGATPPPIETTVRNGYIHLRIPRLEVYNLTALRFTHRQSQ